MEPPRDGHGGDPWGGGHDPRGWVRVRVRVRVRGSSDLVRVRVRVRVP